MVAVSEKTTGLFYEHVMAAFSDLDEYRRTIRLGIAVDPLDIEETCEGLAESLRCYQLASGRMPAEES